MNPNNFDSILRNGFSKVNIRIRVAKMFEHERVTIIWNNIQYRNYINKHSPVLLHAHSLIRVK